MALNPEILYQSLQRLPNVDNEKAAADAWADAYVKYAKDAIALDAIPVLKPKEVLAAAVLPIILGKTFHTGISSVLSLYWVGIPFVGALNNGPIAIVSGASVLDTALAKLAADAAASISRDFMREFANALDAFTRTAIANLANSAGTVIPTPIS